MSSNYLCTPKPIPNPVFKKIQEELKAESDCSLTVDDFLSLSGEEPSPYDELCGDHPGSVTHDDRYFPDEEELPPEVLLGFGQRLSEVSPIEFAKYFDRFVRYSPQHSYHVKYGYASGFVEKQKKGTDIPQPFFEELAVEMTERHLDHEHWRIWKRYEKSNPIWLGLHFPKCTTVDAIDIDAKKYLIGWYRVHKDEEKMPIVRLPLEHLQLLKRIYDAFPKRIWCISSETLGVHAWRLHAHPQSSMYLHSQNKYRLAEIGLPSIEAHPMPGRCFRRPMGADYRTITPNGILETWIDQLEYFENVRATATFDQICRALWIALKSQWMSFLNAAEATDAKGVKVKCRDSFLMGFHDDRVQFTKWRDAGFPLEALPPCAPRFSAVEQMMADVFDATLGEKRSAPKLSAVEQMMADVFAETLGEKPKLPPSPAQHPEKPAIPNPEFVDYRNRNWTKALKKLATEGLTQPDSIGFAALEIAKWLYWVELFQVPEQQRKSEIFDLLHEFVRTKANGFIDRWSSGQKQDVLSQLARCVDAAEKLQINNRDYSVDLFGRIRAKWEGGEYTQPLKLVPLLKGIKEEEGEKEKVEEKEKDSFSSSTLTMCIRLDASPLPESVIQELQKYSGKAKLLPFATKLINYLFEKDGSVRIGRPALFKMLGHRNPSRLVSYLKRIELAKVIVRGKKYSIGNCGKLCSLTPWVMEEMSRVRESPK